MKSLLIYNPVSGKKEGKNERLGRFVSNLTEGGNEVTVYQTQGKKDAQAYLTGRENSGYDRIICCGGDGTLHEIINGMMKSGWNIPVGYIPMGSTNDYAKNLGISRQTALRCLQEGAVSRIDVGSMNGEYFNYVAAFGIFTSVSFHTPQEKKNSLGYFAYLLEGIKQLTDISPKHIRFCVDGEWKESEILVGMITNTFSIAGIKNFKRKDVLLDDGRMEYLFIKFPKNFMELQTVITLLLNEKIDERYMYYGQFHEMQMETEPMEWTLDGEDGGLQEFAELKIHPGAVAMIHKKQEKRNK